MSEKSTAARPLSPTDVLAPHDTAGPSTPIWLVSEETPADGIGTSDTTARQWLDSVRFTSAAKKQAIFPGPDGTLAGVALGQGSGKAGDPSGPSELLVGQLAPTLPAGLYHLAQDTPHAALAAVAWGLGAYRFRRYKTAASDVVPALSLIHI